MADLLLLAIGASLLDHVVLASVLGPRAVAPPSRRINLAMHIGLATAWVVTIATVLGYVAWHWLLEPYSLGELRPLLLALLVAALAQAADRLTPTFELARRNTSDHATLMVTINGALLVR